MVLLGLAMLVVPGLACGQGESTAAPGLTVETFAEVVIALREAERGLAESDSAGTIFAERKAQILARYDTSEEELRTFLVDHGADLETLRQAWDSISERLKHVPAADSISPAPRRSRLMEAEPVREQTLH